MRRRLVRHIRRLGLRVLSLNPTYLDLNLISINDGIRQETTRQLRATLELCHDLEAEMVVVIPGRRHILIPSPFNDASGVLDRELLPLLDYAERLSVRVCLENGPSLFLEKADQVRTVCDRLRHRALAMLFDVANSHMVEPVAHALEGVAASVSLIHLSDTSDPFGRARPSKEGFRGPDPAERKRLVFPAGFLCASRRNPSKGSGIPVSVARGGTRGDRVVARLAPVDAPPGDASRLRPRWMPGECARPALVGPP